MLIQTPMVLLVFIVQPLMLGKVVVDNFGLNDANINRCLY
jgi:hypothetical protein